MIVAVASVFGASSLQAQDPAEPVTVVKINKHDGTVSKFQLPSKPVVNVVGDKFVVNGTEIQKVEFLRSEVSHIDFAKEVPAGVTDVEVNEFVFTYLDNNTVQMTSPKLHQADLYNLSGHKLASVPAQDGVVTMSLENFPAGIYLVAPDCHPAIKVLKK